MHRSGHVAEVFSARILPSHGRQLSGSGQVSGRLRYHPALMDLESRTRAIIARLASVPNGPDDARAFMQRRLGALLRLCGSLWCGVWLLNQIVWLASPHAIFAAARPGTTFYFFHFVTGASLLVAWALLRRGEPSFLTLSLIDLGATFFQVLVYPLSRCARRRLRPRRRGVLPLDRTAGL